MPYTRILLSITVIPFLLAGCFGTSGVKDTPEQGKTGAAGKTVHTGSVNPLAARKFQSALDAMQSGDEDLAKQILLPLVVEFPDLSGPQANLGILYFRKNESDKAEEAFNAAIKINPESAVSYNHLGIISRNKGKFDTAEELYEKALDIDPDYAYAHLNLGILYDLYLGKLSSAMKHYKRYQSLSKEEDKVVSKWLIDLKRRIKRSRR